VAAAGLRRADDGDPTSRLEELSLEEVEGFLIQKAMARWHAYHHDQLKSGACKECTLMYRAISAFERSRRK